MNIQRHLLAFALIPLAGLACSSAEPGQLTIAIYGEEFIEEGIPADELVDGWAISFDKFLVSVGDVSAAEAAEAPAIASAGYVIVDLAQPSGGIGFEIASAEVVAGTYDNVSYRIASSSTATALDPSNASSADVATMTSNNYAVFVSGSATKGAATKSFEWGFATPTRYGNCAGTAVIDGEAGRLELTIHGDHLFYDDLISDEPNVAFDLIAAADDSGNADGVVTEAELSSLAITGEARYQVGNFDIDELWSYIDRQVSTVGHIDGEGHCDDAVRE